MHLDGLMSRKSWNITHYSTIFASSTTQKTPPSSCKSNAWQPLCSKCADYKKIEAALFQKARNLAEIRAKERQSIPSLANQDPEQAILIAQLAAMPDMDRLATLQRYQTSLDRQLSKVIGEIRVLTMNPIDAPNTTHPKDHREAQTIRTIEKNSDGSTTTITRLRE